MNQDKMHLINKIFNNETIRTVWDKEDEKYYISVVDIVGVLSGKRKCLLAIAIAFSTFGNAQLVTYPEGLNTGMPHNDDYTVCFNGTV